MSGFQYDLIAEQKQFRQKLRFLNAGNPRTLFMGPSVPELKPTNQKFKIQFFSEIQKMLSPVVYRCANSCTSSSSNGLSHP